MLNARPGTFFTQHLLSLFRCFLVPLCFVGASSCNLTDDSLRGSINSESSESLTWPPDNWSFKGFSTKARSNDPSPIIQGQIPATFDGSLIKIFTDSSCSVQVGSATSSGGSFEVTNIDLTASSPSTATKSFYATVSGSNLDAKTCASLSLELDYITNGQLVNAVPLSVSLGEDDSIVYISDAATHEILRLNVNTGKMSTVYNSNQGSGPSPSNIRDIFYSAATEKIYLVDSTLDALIQVDPQTGSRETIADIATGSGATLFNPSSIQVNQSGTIAYVGDFSLNAIIAVNLSTGHRTIIADAGTGTGPSLEVDTLVLNSAETHAYVLGTSSDEVYEVELSSGNRTIIASASVGTGASLGNAVGKIALSSDESVFYLANDINQLVIEVDVSTGNRSVVADDSTGTGTLLISPKTLIFDPTKNDLYCLDGGPDGLVRINTTTWNRTSIYDTSIGTGLNVFFSNALALNSSGTVAYIAETDLLNDALFSVDLTTGNRTIISKYSTGVGTGSSLLDPSRIIIDAAGTAAYLMSGWISRYIVQVDLATGNRTVVSSNSVGTGSTISSPNHFTLNPAETTAYITGLFGAVYAIDLATGNRSVVSDGSTGTGASFAFPSHIGVNSANTKLYVANGSPVSIIEVDIATGNRTTLSGPSNGTGQDFSEISSMTLNAARTLAYVVDLDAEVILEVDLVTGNRTVSKTFDLTTGLGASVLDTNMIPVHDSSLSYMYIRDNITDALFKVDLSDSTKAIISK